MKGQVIRAHGGFYEVLTEEGMVTCRLRGRNKQGRETIVPGDYVDIEHTDSEGTVERILPRKNHIHRPTLANIDQLLIVSALAQPGPDYLLNDRLLATALYFDITPLLCFNKCDLGHSEAPAAYYRETGLTLFETSIYDPESLVPLTRALDGKITALAGNSGVGKSSLSNALLKDSAQSTSAVSERAGRGRHTTRTAIFLPLETGSGFLVDTPGFNVFAMSEDLDPQRLSTLYPEYLARVDSCRFANCLHDNEPDCEVKRAVAAGVLSEDRYANYRLLLHELSERKRR